MRGGEWSVRGLAGRVVLGVACVVAVWQAYLAARHAVVVGANDFQWSGSRLLLRGVDAYQRVLAGDVSGIRMTQIPNYSPALYVLLLPLGVLPLTVAQTLWTFLNLAMLTAAAVLVGRAAGLRSYGVLTLVVALFLSWPFSIAVQAGQQTALALLGAVLACRLRSRAGAGLGLGVMLTKYSFAPVALVPLLARRWGVLAVAAALQAAGLLVFCLMTGSAVGTTLLEPLRTARTLQNKGAADAMTFGRLIGLPEVGVFLLAAVLLVALCWVARRVLCGPVWLDALSVGSLLSLMTFPHLIYDLCFMLPVLGSAVSRRGWSRGFLGCTVLMLWFGWALDPTYARLSSGPGIVETWLLLLAALLTIARVPASPPPGTHRADVGPVAADLVG